MLLYFASRIYPQGCMVHVLKSEVFIRGRGGMGGTQPMHLSQFSGSAPDIACYTYTTYSPVKYHDAQLCFRFENF